MYTPSAQMLQVIQVLDSIGIEILLMDANDGYNGRKHQVYSRDKFWFSSGQNIAEFWENSLIFPAIGSCPSDI